MLKAIPQWLRLPQFPDAEKNRIARTVHVLIVALTICLLVPILKSLLMRQWGTVAAIVFAEVSMVIAFRYNQRAAVTVAVHLLVAAFLLVATSFMWAHNGIHDHSVVALPAVLILASLLVNYRSLIFFTLAAIACVALTVIAELNGWLVTPMSRFTSMQDLIRIGAILIGTAATAGFLTVDLHRTRKKISQNETASIESEKNYRQFFNASNEAIYVYDPQAERFLDANDTAVEMFGFSRDELVGHTLADVVSDLTNYTADDAMRLIRKSMAEGPQVFEWRSRKKNGEFIWTEVSLKSLRDGGRETVLAVVRDISERKRLDEMLKSIVAATAYSVGEEYFPTLVAQIAHQFGARYVMVGYLTDKGKKMQTLAVWSGNGLGKNFDYDLANTPCENVVKHGLCVYPKDVQKLFPKDRLLADMEVEGYCGTLIVDKGRRPLGILEVLDDKPLSELDEKTRSLLSVFAARTGAEIERLQSDQALRKSEEKFSKAFQCSPVVYTITRAEDMRYIAVNEAFEHNTGYTAEEAIGRTILELGILANPEKLGPYLDELKATGRVRNLEYQARTRQGKLLTGLVSSELIEIGGETCIVAVSEDITQRKEAERLLRESYEQLEQRVKERTAELQAANVELEAFSYSVSHDLQAPLRSINAFTKCVLEDFGPQLPDEARQYLEIVVRSSDRMRQLIQDLLTFSRSSRQPLQKTRVDLTSLVQETYDELRQDQASRDVEFRLGQLPQCFADKNLLKQVLVNLLSNALKFTSKKETAVIEVDSFRQDNENVVFVRDNGTGFDMQYSSRLFGAFQRLHNLSDFQGTGLGLSIVQRIIQRHGGRVWAESQPNNGATFYFTLPS